MLIRIATAISNKDQQDMFVQKLIGISIMMEVDFDIARYSNHFDKLLNNIENIDIIILDSAVLESNKERIGECYIRNTKCLPVLFGVEKNKLGDYLIVRPIEYIDSTKIIMQDAEVAKMKKICDLFLHIANKRIEDKTDNSVLYITTRQKSYAISKNSILYCQSDLKYTVFVLDNGMLIRKLEKLQSIKEKYLWDFKRVHQSFLVNPKMIESVDKTTNEIVLINATRVPFSRKYAADLRQWFNN